MSAINNLVRATKKTVSATVNLAALSTELLADGAELINASVGQAKPISKAVLSLPFATAEGYLIAEGATPEAAKAKAYHFVDQAVAVTIAEVGVGSGKLLSALLKEDDVVSTDSKEDTRQSKSASELMAYEGGSRQL